MRIAQVTYSTKPRGGVVHTLALAEALARRGHEVTVWTLGRGGDDVFFRDVDPAVSIRVVPFPERTGEDVGARIRRSIETMRDAFEPDDHDVVHAQDCISANAVGRCIRTIHHLDEFTTPELVACHDRAIREPIARLCVSAAVAAEVEAGWGLVPTVIPNGVDAARFAEADGSPFRERFGPYVLALGGIEPRKGSLDLLEAMAGVSGARLVFGGGETLFDYRPYREAFDRRLAELGLPVEILGVLDEADVAPLVAGASALAFVSTKEGFGLAAMEALAAGVPVVARDLPVLREVFGDAVTYAADVPAITAALERVLSGDAPAPALGMRLARSHDWDDVASRHESFYRRLAGGGDHGQALDLADHHLAG
ncbi:GDP-mannose-dependent alpha-(1-2)-phosphatidylinositol mannosyltransferase [Frondihabitans sp. 762G35]|uniref:MSMEG_0565 family glycosyltransferase n=1 Tax=Frondihabitans sp. 762G35 TaxID=1446794 RepID=UPI000D21A181|nr:MSMEG_0565 family glycosyltransferase [Frondihabitans sp. 762G35]ARC58317.1 GDP-mannose-dependent alpha-(1-2)-phosphatidylinositol mannosyltransferase [Frondihabitans sp. 762G35]